MTVSLPQLLEQARRLHGTPRAGVVAGRSGLFDETRLPIPGWLVGTWDFADGRVGRLTEKPKRDFRILWLAETGHLVWVMVNRGLLQDDSTLLVVDTPGDFKRHVVPLTDIGDAVWDDAQIRLPILERFDADMIGPWRVGGDPSTAGGPALLADPSTRGFNDRLLDQVRQVQGPGSIEWTDDAGPLKMEGHILASATEGEVARGAKLSSAEVVALLMVTSVGNWVRCTRTGPQNWQFEFFDTVGDFHWNITRLHSEDHLYPRMWKTVMMRHPMIRDLDRHPLSRWR